MKTEASSVEEKRKRVAVAVAVAGTDGRSGERAMKKRGGGCGARTGRKRVHAASRAIQRLFEACRRVFKGPGTVPSPVDVEMLQLLLDRMTPENVGLSSDIHFFKNRSTVKGTPRIRYTTIYTCENFSMCIFFLPPTAVIPLHNHPGMTVFSKLLLGSMHIKSYDWVDPEISDDTKPSSKFRLARLVVDSDFTARSNTLTLYPAAGGNMHTFTAITPCAVLDVLGPPYSKEDDRDCTYYRDYPYSHFQDGAAARAGEPHDQLGWLEKIEIPEDTKMDGVEYLGPQIIDG